MYRSLGDGWNLWTRIVESRAVYFERHSSSTYFFTIIKNSFIRMRKFRYKYIPKRPSHTLSPKDLFNLLNFKISYKRGSSLRARKYLGSKIDFYSPKDRASYIQTRWDVGRQRYVKLNPILDSWMS